MTADAAPSESEKRAGPILALWMALMVALQGAVWIAGFRPAALESAVERGSAKIETKGVGEVADEVIRKAIRMQQDSLPFWRTLVLIGDLAIAPLGLAVRAFLVATFFAGVAALTGRPIGFAEALAACAKAQGFWVLGKAVQVALMFALRRNEVETSLALFLPAGTYPATAWVGLRQVDFFALMGWIALVRGGWKRGQVNLATAIAICTSLWLVEATLAVAGTLVVEAGMRLTLIPERTS